MATIAERFPTRARRPDQLSGTPRAHAIDRWIFVFMAGWYIAIILTGFIPDSIMKVGMVEAGQRPPFPIVLHMHAVLMGSYLALTFAQCWLMATGRNGNHVKLGLLAFVLIPALVIVGFILAPTMYHQNWNAMQSAPPAVKGKLQDILSIQENILLLQIRAGLLFPLFAAIGLRARRGDAGLHKRMMILAPSFALGAGIDRITWLPNTMPWSNFGADLWVLFAVAPLFIWDVIRNRRVHEAFWIWAAISVPAMIVVTSLWDKPWWHPTARHIMGV